MRFDELLADPTRVEALTPWEACSLLLACSALLTALAARAWGVPAQQPSAPDASDPLLTMLTVAEVLGIPESRARELGRRGELPTVNIGKYVRVRKSDLDTWVAAHRQNRLDQTLNRGYSLYQGYKERRDWARVSPHSQAAGSQSSQARRSDGHDRNERGAMGARRKTNQRACGPIPSTPGDKPGTSKD